MKIEKRSLVEVLDCMLVGGLAAFICAGGAFWFLAQKIESTVPSGYWWFTGLVTVAAVLWTYSNQSQVRSALELTPDSSGIRFHHRAFKSERDMRFSLVHLIFSVSVFVAAMMIAWGHVGDYSGKYGMFYLTMAFFGWFGFMAGFAGLGLIFANRFKEKDAAKDVILGMTGLVTGGLTVAFGAGLFLRWLGLVDFADGTLSARENYLCLLYHFGGTVVGFAARIPYEWYTSLHRVFLVVPKKQEQPEEEDNPAHWHVPEQ